MMSETEIMTENLSKMGQEMLAAILSGFADRVESVEITTKAGNATISKVVKLRAAA